MRLEFTAAGGELFIHLDAGGLAELMKAVQQAMESGVGRLKAGPAGGGSFGAVTVTFAAPGSGEP